MLWLRSALGLAWILLGLPIFLLGAARLADVVASDSMTAFLTALVHMGVAAFLLVTAIMLVARPTVAPVVVALAAVTALAWGLVPGRSGWGETMGIELLFALAMVSGLAGLAIALHPGGRRILTTAPAGTSAP